MKNADHPQMMQSLAVLSKAILLAAVAAVAIQPSSAVAVTTWDWSFTTSDPGISGSGTFTTADVTPAAFTNYGIAGISGSITYDGMTSAITGLSSYNGSDNLFAWNGTASSSLLATSNGISFETATESYNLFAAFFSVPDNDLRVDFICLENADVCRGINTQPPLLFTSSLQPRTDGPAPVPGPLPILGAGAAFGWSRKLRRRISTSSFRM